MNERLRGPIDPTNHTIDSLNRELEVRMPFHDLVVCIEGDSAIDYAHHFV